MLSENPAMHKQKPCQTMSYNQGSLKRGPGNVVDKHTIEVVSEQTIQNTSSTCLPHNCPVARHQLGTLCKLMTGTVRKLVMH